MDIEAKDVKEFQFRSLRKIRLIATTDAKSDNSCNRRVNQIAVSNIFGYTFCGSHQGFCVVRSEEIHKQVVTDKHLLKVEVTDLPFRTVPLPSSPSYLALSCDNAILAVCIQVEGHLLACMFDVRALCGTEFYPTPFARVRLSQTSCQVLDFSWSPTDPEVFACVTSDGGVISVKVLEKGYSIVASLTGETGASCCCWSPKGKQLVIGKKDGSFVQLKPTLQAVKPVTVPRSGLEVADIFWLSTAQFMVAYHDVTSNRTVISLVNLTKDGTPQFVWFDDVCYARNDDIMPQYFFQHVAPWNLIICGSTRSPETAVIACAQNGQWEIWSSDDIYRAELPTSRNGDTFPIGFAIDFCNQNPVAVDETLVVPSAPMLLMLSTDGLLCPFHVLNLFPTALSISLTQKAQNIPAGEPRRGTDAAAVPASVALTSQGSVTERSASLAGPTLSRPVLSSQLPSTTISSITEPLTNSGLVSSVAPAAIEVPPQQVDSSAQQEERTDAARRRLQAERERVLQEGILIEINEFNKELSDLQQKLCMPLGAVGSREELVTISKDTATVMDQLSKQMEVCLELSSDCADARRNVVDSLYRADEAVVRQRERNSAVYKQLLRNMPMDAARERKVKEMKFSVSQLDQVLSTLTLRVKATPARKGTANGNALDMVYRTLSNMQEIIAEQSKRINQVKLKLVKLENEGIYLPKAVAAVSRFSPSLNGTSLYHPETPTLNKSFAPRIAAGRDSVPPCAPTPVKQLLPEQRERLAQILASRSSVPRRTSAPVVLTPPKSMATVSKRLQDLESKLQSSAERAEVVPTTVIEGVKSNNVPPAVVTAQRPRANLGQITTAASAVAQVAEPTTVLPKPVPLVTKPAVPTLTGLLSQPTVTLATVPSSGIAGIAVTSPMVKPTVTVPQTQTTAQAPTPVVTAPFGGFQAPSSLKAPPNVSLQQMLASSKPQESGGFMAPISAPASSSVYAAVTNILPTKALSAVSFGSPAIKMEGLPVATVSSTSSHFSAAAVTASSASTVSLAPTPAPAPTVAKPLTTGAALTVNNSLTTATTTASLLPLARTDGTSTRTSDQQAPVVATAANSPKQQMGQEISMPREVGPPATTAAAAATVPAAAIPAASPATFSFALSAKAAPDASKQTQPSAVAPESAGTRIVADNDGIDMEPEPIAVASTAPTASPATFSFALGGANASVPSSTSGDRTSGGFFSGLGGKPSIENANRNVFGGFNLAASGQSPQQTNLFGAQTSSPGFGTFGSSPAAPAATNTSSSATGFGSFSSGGGSIASAGFGALGGSPQQIANSSFGAPSVLGGGSAFGSAPSFGTGASFGSPAGFGSSSPAAAFGSPSANTSGGFGSFGGGSFSALAAKTDVPTFGSLASSTGAFGASSTGGFGSFGQSNANAAGSGAFGSPSFGSFSSPTGSVSQPAQQSSFSQWR